MPSPADHRLLTLSGLRHRCAIESDRFFSRQEHDPRYCFELFRRAINDHNQQAWQFVYEQYRPLVSGWVERNSLFRATEEETQYFVNRAFEKMWVAVTPAKFKKFPNLKSVLSYLQMCVHSVLVDYVRGREQATLLDQETLARTPAGEGANVERQVRHRIDGQALWRWLDGRLKDEKERCVVYGTFSLAMKPRELLAHYPETFRDVNEVYRVKENVMARLRRDDELKKRLMVGSLDAGESASPSVYQDRGEG
jgi:hypothetical protein